MARSVFHRPLENPLQLAKLPHTRPRLEWPIEVNSFGDDESRQAIWQLVCLCLSVGCTYLLTSLSDAAAGSDFGVLIIVLIFVLVFYHALADAEISLFQVFGTLAWIVVLWLFYFHAPYLALCFGLLLLPLLAFLARRNYVFWACASPLDRAEAEEFRRRGTLPAGVRRGPFWPAYWQALVLWLNYNRIECQAPGTFQSPAGPRPIRLFLIFTTVILLACSLPSLLRPTFGPYLEGSLLVALPAWILTFLAPLVVVLFAILLAGCSIFPAAYALQKVCNLPANWKSFNHALQTSPDPIESDSLFLGSVYYDSSPVLLPIDILHRHAWLVGSTGSGKTTYLMFLIEQLIARNWSVIYVDLKATDYAPPGNAAHGPRSGPEESTAHLPHESPTPRKPLTLPVHPKLVATAERHTKNRCPTLRDGAYVFAKLR